MIEHSINNSKNFILGYYDNDDICDELIKYHNESESFPGRIASGLIDRSVKNSSDVTLENIELYKKYVYGYLQPKLDRYIETYNFVNKYAPWTIYEEVLVQHYHPGQGFYEWHTERCTGKFPAAARHLVFMTYLNDVPDGGTEFYYQGIKIKAEKGLTLFWPSDWTFTHRGIISSTKEKYICTGWYSFTDFT